MIGYNQWWGIVDEVRIIPVPKINDRFRRSKC